MTKDKKIRQYFNENSGTIHAQYFKSFEEAKKYAKLASDNASLLRSYISDMRGFGVEDPKVRNVGIENPKERKRFLKKINELDDRVTRLAQELRYIKDVELD